MPHFTEIQRLEDLTLAAHDELLHVEHLAHVSHKGSRFPLIGLTIGARDRNLPTLGLFGGVHGLERVGTHVVLAFLESFLTQLKWDEELRKTLGKMRLVALPLINPAGMFFGTRSNGNGVDLMRNAPIEAQARPALLLGGHRLSPLLPWYRGRAGAALETEAQVLVDFVKREMFDASVSLAVDFHSGFGLQDRLWYPYAKTTEPFPRLAEVRRIQELFEKTHPHHVYQIEPQSISYTTHGDLWDYLFDEHYRTRDPGRTAFIPWTLEMGSWQWVRKNPRQLFQALGPFNPIKPHRYKRVMRRHITLIEFFLRTTLNSRAWFTPEIQAPSSRKENSQ